MNNLPINMDETNQTEPKFDLEKILREYKETGELDPIALADLAEEIYRDKSYIEDLKRIEEAVLWGTATQEDSNNGQINNSEI